MTMPTQKPGRSKQDYNTPPEFIRAVKRLLRIEDFIVDLAADSKNAVAPIFYDLEHDALAPDNPWRLGNGWAWCNPPFGFIRPWVEKASYAADEGAHIAMLVPASVGSNWWAEWVDRDAHVLFLQGRLTFVGEKTPYPKDCALLLYTPAILGGYEVWDWRADA